MTDSKVYERKLRDKVDVTSYAATIWLTGNYANLWFIDALNEARSEPSRDSNRRQIIFAVCFIESYLFEWVRDEVLKGDYASIDKYFPITQKRGIKDRWKEVIKQLHDEDLIPDIPDYRTSTAWEDFNKLVDYRDGLVHGAASRPETSSQPNKNNPVPSTKQLSKIESDWPTKAAVNLVGELHQTTNTQTPDWLELP